MADKSKELLVVLGKIFILDKVLENSDPSDRLGVHLNELYIEKNLEKTFGERRGFISFASSIFPNFSKRYKKLINKFRNK